jgi:hypothetical protein
MQLSRDEAVAVLRIMLVFRYDATFFSGAFGSYPLLASVVTSGTTPTVGSPLSSLARVRLIRMASACELRITSDSSVIRRLPRLRLRTPPPAPPISRTPTSKIYWLLSLRNRRTVLQPQPTKARLNILEPLRPSLPSMAPRAKPVAFERHRFSRWALDSILAGF